MPAVSQSQQRFFGMVRAAQKGELKSPSPKVAKAANGMTTQDAHDFAATKHTGLPTKVANHLLFAEKLAYVELNPTDRVASKPPPFQHPPSIGQRKSLQPVPPATADAKMVMRTAPSVPNPIVPAAQSADPLPTMKVASRTVPIAPRYTAKGAKGKKPMPQPFARRTKTAAEFGSALALGCEKRALGGLGTAVGAAGGLLGSPSGSKMEGLGRGVGQGMGWDVGGGVGMGLGAAGGAAAGGLAGPAIASLLAALRGQTASPDALRASMATGAAGGLGFGGVSGYFGGGMAGRGLAQQMMGHPSWEQDKQDQDVTAAQMAAP